MIDPTTITDRMERAAENRTGGDLRGGSRSGRNMSRPQAGDAVKATAKRREGQLFPDADIQNNRTYQISPE
jgi:hypothetical protein